MAHAVCDYVLIIIDHQSYWEELKTFLRGKHQRDKAIFTRIIIPVFICCKCGMD